MSREIAGVLDRAVRRARGAVLLRVVITVIRHARDLALVVFLMCILVALPAALVLARTMPREDDLYD